MTSETDATTLAHEIGRSRTIASLLLANMLVLLLCTRGLRDTHPIFGVIEAFSEAALIGGLADWFAVTALFRYPLGIPIPHTAIIPNNRQRIAENLSEFIVANFFGGSANKKIAGELDLASSLATWLADPSNRTALLRGAGAFIGKEGGLFANALTKVFTDLTLQKAQRTNAPVLLAEGLEILFTGPEQRSVFTQSLGLGREFVGHHKEFLEHAILGAAPWFIPTFVTNRVASGVVQRIERTLLEMQEDENHPARSKLRSSVTSIIHSLRTDHSLQSRVTALRDAGLRSPSLRIYLGSLIQRLKAGVSGDLCAPNSEILSVAEDFTQELALQLTTDPGLRDSANAIAQELVRIAGGSGGDEFRRYISATILRWDSALLVEKIELQVGKDLQFIRINGTLVGGLIGVVLYLFEDFMRF